jgi:hypothetical protein
VYITAAGGQNDFAENGTTVGKKDRRPLHNNKNREGLRSDFRCREYEEPDV